MEHWLYGVFLGPFIYLGIRCCAIPFLLLARRLPDGKLRRFLLWPHLRRFDSTQQAK